MCFGIHDSSAGAEILSKRIGGEVKRPRNPLVSITVFLMAGACFAYAQSPTVTGKTKAEQGKAVQPVRSEQRPLDLSNSAERRLDAIDKRLDGIDKRLGQNDIGSQLGEIKTALG